MTPKRRILTAKDFWSLPKATAIARRFWSKVKVVDDEGCWEWQSTLAHNGYGLFSIYKKPHYAHRIAYILADRDILDGQYICHHCDNPKCVRQDHLFAGTAKDNSADCVRKNRQARGARFGHRYTCRGSESGSSKLTEDQVRRIRALYGEGYTTIQLLECFGVAQSTISLLLSGKTWRHVDGPIVIQKSGARGERHPRSKLTAEQVLQIRECCHKGGINYSALAREYGVSPETIRRVASGQQWQGVELVPSPQTPSLTHILLMITSG